MANEDWVPTAKLRWVKREVTPAHGSAPTIDEMFNLRVLQIWYSQDVPGYMRKDAEGEWRDVELVDS